MRTKKENPLIILGNFIRERDMKEKKEKMKLYYKEYYQKHKEKLKSYERKKYKKENLIGDMKIDIQVGKYIIEL
jgi:hypothetical protein